MAGADCSARSKRNNGEGPVIASQSSHRAASEKSDRASPQDEAQDAAAPGTSANASSGATVRRPYLAKLAHELKTPLSAIATAADVMREESFGPLGDERYKTYSTDIHRLALHALDVINRMMATRPSERAIRDRGRDIVEIDVVTLIGEMRSALAPIAERSAIVLDVRTDDDLPLLVADAVEVRQMLFNVLTNALKFTPEGGAITLVAALRPETGLDLGVLDTGPGIGADVVRRVLPETDMRRAEANTAADGGTAPPPPVAASEARQPALPNQLIAPRVGAGHSPGARESTLSTGLGLGLPLVRSLAERNGGTLIIESPPDGRQAGALVAMRFGMGRLVFP